MADNEKLVFQIGFDLDSAVKDATSEWKRVQRELEAAINARPISISMDTRGLERFNTFVERTYASLEDLQDLFPEVFKETKDGEGITKRFQAMETSINAVSKEMRNLEKVWNNLSQAEKFDDDGNLTERAQELKRAYVELYQSQKTQGQTLQEITKEAINLANQEYEAQQRKKKQEEDFIRLLNLEETTLEKLQAKQGAWKQKLSQTEIGTSDWSNAIAEVQRLETKIKDLQKQIKGVATETKKTSKTKVDIDTSTFAGKLKDLENRWKALNAEQRKGAEGQALRAEWRKLSEEAGRYTSTLRSAVSAEDRLANAKKKTTKATHEQNSAYKTQGSYLSRLFQRMVAYASVAQAFSFVRNVRDVTAEFELQRVALGSIIGDLNEANAMFEQIKAAAVKSPFQIKELVTYTKQLAAYKIEQDELFETTQRLADISAGLGVGMERLVLAYGQIRATGYLRASEVRQLTEAGIPIVEELAKKMSQLRGETVSAAEVMGLISERAISFGMVKEVFDDMTSAGGMFYKMQEKQAETLAGQWSNLQDAISIMYDEIGNTEGVNNSIKGTIGLVKSLAENWRVVGDVAVWSVGAAMGYAKVIKPLSELIQKHRLLNKAKEAEIRAEKNLERIRTLNRHKELFADDQEYIQWVDDEIKKLQEYADKHTKIATEARKSASTLKGFGGALKSIGSFIKANWVGMLITAITAVVSGLISARQEANRLNKELAKIGTEGALQADQSVRNFERLARAIRESADGSAKQTEALAEMKRAYGDFLPSQDEAIINLAREKDGYNAITQAIREKIALQIQEQKLNTIASEYGSRITKKETKLKDWLTGEDWRSVDKFSQEEATRITNAIRQAVSDGLISAGKDWEENAHTINRIIREQTGEWGSVDVMHGIERQKYEEFIDILYDMNDQVQQVEWSMESATGSLGKYTQAYKDFKEELKDVTGTGEKFSFEWNESKTKAEIKAYNEFIGDLLSKEGIKFDIGEAIDFKGLYEALGDNYPQLKQVVAKIQGEYEKLVPKDLEKLIKEQFSTLATKYGASLDKLQHYFKSADQSTQDWVKTLKDAKTELGNQIFDAKKLDKDTTALEAQKQVIEAMITAWDNSEKTQKAGAKSAEQALKDELAAVEKIYKRYQDLRKLKSGTDTQSILANEFKGVNLTTLSKAYSPKQMIEVYQKALAEAQRLGKKDLVLEIQTKLGEFNVAEEQRKLEKSLKDLSDKISRTKTAKEFFDRMLGLTGDKELSATLTLSVYGTTGDDLKSALIKQVERAFEGVDISDAIDYNTMTINYQKLSEIYADNQDKILDANKSMAESIVKDGQKASASQIEQWAKELEAVKTYADKRVDIAKQTQQRISEIEASTLPEDEKQRLQEQYRKKEEKDLAELEYQAFKESPMYVAMFDNLDSASTTMLNNMRAKLMELKEAWGGLDMPTELKEMQSRLNEIDKQLATRNPFKTLATAYESYQELREQGSRKEAEQDLIDKTEKHAKAVSLLDMFTRSATQAQQKYNDAVEKYGEDSNQAMSAKKMLEASNILVDTQKKSVNATEEGVEASQELVNKWKELDDVVGDTWVQVNTLTQAIINLGRNLADAFGGFGSDANAEYFNNMADALSNLVDGASNIAAGIATSNPISVISGIGSLISGMAEWNDAQAFKENNREIERQQKILDDLSITYERLEKEMNDTFGSDRIKNYNDRLAILQAQQEAYQKQAEEERAKGKKADKEKVEAYEEGYRKATDNIKDMQSELSEYFLGTDLTSAARDFANAWIEAYKEFGSTTDAMKEKFHDMIQNMVVESIAGRMMQTLLKPVFDEIDKAAKDGDLDDREIAYIADMGIGLIDVIDEGMTSLMERLRAAGYDIQQSTSGLTGISRDIASASEESILGLAAGINTQNFYISQVPPKLDIIIALLQGGGVQAGSGVNVQDLITIQNQHLSHLPSIAQHTADTVAECKQIVVETRRTADALERVIKPRGTQATHAVNTSL